MDYLEGFQPPFIQSTHNKRIVLRPHQAKSIVKPTFEYQPLELKCPIEEIDCICLKKSRSIAFSQLIDPSGTSPTLLWIDPRFLKTECLAWLIKNWERNIKATQNVALGIAIPKKKTDQKLNVTYELWKTEISGPSYGVHVVEPIWYPSLARNSGSLQKASEDLNPYDVFPLVEFYDIAVQAGEKALTDHRYLLEHFRTRTRNFIYLDVLRPDQAFHRFYGTIRALPRTGTPVFHRVITPGGSASGFLTALLSAVLADTCLMTPREETPFNANTEIQGIMLLRKCI